MLFNLASIIFSVADNMKENKLPKLLLSYICIVSIFVSLFTSTIPTITYAQDRKIEIKTAEEFAKIGIDTEYPLSGDYLLTDDIDLAECHEFTTIGGGYNSTSGATFGSNVFNGTFNGQGHVISNLKLNVITQQNAQIGLFGIIASDDSNDYAKVENIILKDVDIIVNMQATTTVGALAGEVNGYAQINNIAVVGGSIVTSYGNSYGDLIGAGGVIGEIRTANSYIGNQNITISNLYNSADIIANAAKDNKYVAGIIGRIRYGACKSITQCVNMGNVTFKGQQGYAIASISENEPEALSTLEDCYYMESTAIVSDNEANSVSIANFTNGQLLDGLSDKSWSATNGFYLAPKICINSSTMSPLDFIRFNFAQGESFGNINSDFTIPTSYGEEEIIWEVSPNTLPIQNGNVIIDSSNSGIYTLRAKMKDNKTKSYKISVNMNVSISFNEDYAQIGIPLTVSVSGNDIEDVGYSYQWKVGEKVITGNTGNSYTPTTNDLENFISVDVLINGAIADTAQIYFTKLPVIYINTEDGSSEIDKDIYKNAVCKIQGNSLYNKENTNLYEGALEIKGRGNSTWGLPKKPYKLKLNKKTDVFGFGKSKHWVLLANYLDSSIMRNELSYNLSGDLNMPYMQSVSTVLVMNGQYVGTYQFCEQIRIDEERINIFDWEKTSEDVADKIAKENNLSVEYAESLKEAMAQNLSWVTNNKVTFNGTTYSIPGNYQNLPYNGGYLLELDSYYDEISKFQTSLNQPIMFNSPEYQNTNQTMFNYVRSYLNSFEAAIQTPDFYGNMDNKQMHYSSMFDINALVDYWLVNEFFVNEDAMKKSTYLYQDINGLYKMGPIWDMDWATGTGAATNPEVWQTVQFSIEAQNKQWYKYLIGDPYFALKIYERYWDIRNRLEDIIKEEGIIEHNRLYLQEAAQANLNKWTGGTYDTHVDIVKNFLTTRLNWLDKEFKDVDTLLNSLGKYKNSSSISVSLDKVADKNADINIISTVTNPSATDVLFQINSENIRKVSIDNGKASLVVKPSETSLGMWNGNNVIRVFAVDSTGKILSSNNNAVMSYALFTLENKEVPLSGTVTIRGKFAVGNTLTAFVEQTNNTGELNYKWTADNEVIDNATNYHYTITQAELGKIINVTVTSSNESGDIRSEATTSVIAKASKDNIIINQIYGAGVKTEVPISHDFIELYNPTSTDINLDGYRIEYISSTSKATLQLEGIIPSECSYLIRCFQNTTSDPYLKYTINEYDKQWEQSIDNKQYQITLYNDNNYIDGLSIGEMYVEGKNLTTGYISKQKSARRINFIDTDNNMNDFVAISYKDDITDEQTLQTVRPRSLADGKWSSGKSDKLQEVIDNSKNVYENENSKVDDFLKSISDLSKAIVEFTVDNK